VLADEAWLLLTSRLAGRYLLQFAKRLRKYGAGLTLVTQDAADILATDTGRAVISNAATQILLRQAPQAIDAVADAYRLTDGERAFLLTAGQGDALLIAGTHRVAFHTIADDAEADLVHTDPGFTHHRPPTTVP
jgi:DNA helicase HerA-like ATPase